MLSTTSRTRRSPLERRFLAATIFLSLLLCTVSCTALHSPSGIDWAAVNTELKLAVQDIGDLRMLASDNEILLEYIDRVLLALEAVQVGVALHVDGGGDLTDVGHSIDIALTITDNLMQDLSGDDELKAKVAIGITFTRLVLRRIKAYTVE